MKKDIEWLKKEFDEVIEFRKQLNPSSSWGMGSNAVLKYIKEDFKNLTDQLDEPEVLSSDWINNNSIYASSDGVTEEYVHVDDLQNLLVPKQELPVIPKFVANWIETSREAMYHLLGAVYDGAYSEDMKEWLFKGDKRTRQDNQDKLTRAWLDGYEVEEVQKYYIRDQHGVYLLAKTPNVQGKVQTVAEIVEQYGIEEIELGYELSEKEIKDYDPRYWAFRKPIEELEE